MFAVRWLSQATVLTEITFGRLSATNESTEALLVASKQIGLEVNAEKTKYDQNSGQIHNMKLGATVQISVRNTNKSKLQ